MINILKLEILMKISIQQILILISMFGSSQSQSCDIKVNDDTKEGMFLYDLNTFDRYGLSNNQNKNFNLLSKSKVNNLFLLEKSGKLHSAKVIDREQMCKSLDHCCDNKDPCVISLSVAVISDMITEPRTFECRVLISDVNDNSPQFPKEKINISIKESENIGTRFSLPFAYDLDSERFSVRDYKLEGKDMFPPIFSLEQHRSGSNLNLQLNQKLDREKCSSYELVLLAIDRGMPPKTGRLIININVIDVNDNPPQLLRTNYIINQEEGKNTAEPITTIEAKDIDENENAQLFFKIIDENPLKNDAIKYFRIEQNTGKIFLREFLDFEKQEKHKFFVEVSNNIGHVETATATVLVNVENLNDEKPEISIDYLNNNDNNAVIKENSAMVKFVAIATVNDKDKGIGGQVNCRLLNFNDVFEIQRKEISTIPNQYNILTKVSLNRESMGHYEVQMECEDKGFPVQRTKAFIKVNVEDVNDNKPVIKLDNNISVKENQPIGTLITKISATDLDEGMNSELVYSIGESDEQTQKYLEINSQTGELKTKIVIDRERDHEPLIHLPVVITVSDKGESPLNARKSFSVKIEDENDNAPDFGAEIITFSVTENQPPRYTLGEIPVTDRDDTSQLRVFLANHPNDNTCPFVLFQKDNKYYLNTTRSLDMEKEQNFSLKVIASDGRGYKSNTVTATVLVSVRDENDHSPMIIFPQQNNSTIHKISYLENIDFTVLTVSAKDRDNSDSPNGKFYFQLANDEKNLFNINANTGKITTARLMSKQDLGKHSIKVVVHDQGTPPKESSIQLTIEVDDSKSNYRLNSHEEDKEANEYVRRQSSIYFFSKESFLITSLIILLLFLLLCIFMILYMRHTRGLFPMLPDIFEGCFCFVDERSKPKKNTSYNKASCDIPIHESRTFTSRSSPLDFPPGVRNNESSLMPFYLNQYDASTANNAQLVGDHKLAAVSQLRHYETMKFQPYSPAILNSKTLQNYNYDQLFYHHPSSSPCEDSYIFPLVSSSNINNIYESRIKTVPNNINSDLSTCHRIKNNIEPFPLINDNRKETFSSNPCLKSDPSENIVIEPSITKTPDVRRHGKKSEKIDTYAVTYPKEQSTFV